jgi:hypothetical protein
MRIGDRVQHAMGHRGTVVAVDGPHSLRALVSFTNTVSWVWTSDLALDILA